MTMMLSRPRTFTSTREIEQLAKSQSESLVAAPRLTVIVPTYCEAENVDPMIAALDAALAGIRWEVIFVDDDSPDGTARLVRERGEQDSRVRAVRRIGRRGLAGAVIEGMLASAGKIVAVIDGDLQHDERLLPRMLAEIEGGADLVIASRYTGAGNASGGFSKIRQRWSPASHASDEQAAQNQSERPDERLLHDPPRRNRRHRPEALDRRLQAAARYPGVVAAGAQNLRAALYVQATAARGFEA